MTTVCLILVALGYLAGSLSPAVLLCRLRGLGDPRKAGSGNPGATNILRLHGKGMAAPVLLADVAKGAAPIVLARILHCPDGFLALVGLATFLGHLYPIFHALQGGKGVATLIGVLLAGHWPVGLVFIGAWLLVFLLFRYSSLAALLACAAALLWGIVGGPQLRGAVLICHAAMAAWLFWRHRGNIRRLLTGQEPRARLFARPAQDTGDQD